VATPGGVVDMLAKHPQLMERPLLVTADRAFIGRPTERVSDFFDGQT
jgi:arsenate reductase